MQKKIYSHIIPEIENWPIQLFSNKRKAFVNKVNEAVVEYFNKFNESDLDQILAKALHQEKQRIKTNPWKADPPNQKQFFRKLQKEYNENQIHPNKHLHNRESVFRLIKRYSEEISGNFNSNTFKFVRKISTIFFHTLFLPFGIKSFSSLKNQKERIKDHLIITGQIEHTRSLLKDNTIILLPTHTSNLDSLMIGYAVDLIAGLPAFSYGAGLNLFDSEFFAFFMNRLGAYKVDRRKKNQIYLQTLNIYSRLSVEDGVNTIFFPGGTRSRSGEVESKLKLGLLSSLISAQRELIEKGSTRKIIIVPVVSSYDTVLEARSLIIQYLLTTGQEKYTARELSPSFGQYIKFIRRFLSKPSSIYLTFGNPLDVFGNILDANGESIDALNHKINLKDYFLSNGEIVHDAQRENIYTKELAEILCKHYELNNYILPSHLVAFAAFQLLSKIFNDQDVYSLVQIPEEEFVFPKKSFYLICDQARNLLFQRSKLGLIIHPDLLEGDLDQVVAYGIETLGAFHIKRVLFIDEFGRLLSEDFLALLYYHNKLENLQLKNDIAWADVPLTHDLIS